MQITAARRPRTAATQQLAGIGDARQAGLADHAARLSRGLQASARSSGGAAVLVCAGES